EFQLFMMCQMWATARHLEAHLGSKQAMIFNDAVMAGRMLVTEPSVSIFGAPLGPSELANLGAEAFAAGIAAEAAGPSSEAPAVAASAAPPKMPLDQSLRSNKSSSQGMQRVESKPSVLRASGAMTLKK
ncbi:unnamed protein product, partial [Polarella glacialis]